ncbi:MAG TPA: energy transducer TonB [Rhodocyclaceae bacterium]|nr:energy transducer TonB [Rhodocyclaceae bacterium]
MSYAQQQRDPRKHLVGISAVVVFHAALIYGLTNGLARKVVDVIKAPLSVNVVEEIKTLPPPPPPPKVVPVQPKVATPPPAYVPPVETPVQAPAAPVITTTSTPQPPAPPAPAAPPAAPPAPAVVSVAVACPNFRSVAPKMPPQAERMGLSGDVVVEFTVTADGQVRDVGVARTSNTVFNGAATQAVAQYRCVGQGKDVKVRQQISFRVDN